MQSIIVPMIRMLQRMDRCHLSSTAVTLCRFTEDAFTLTPVADGWSKKLPSVPSLEDSSRLKDRAVSNSQSNFTLHVVAKSSDLLTSYERPAARRLRAMLPYRIGIITTKKIVGRLAVTRNRARRRIRAAARLVFPYHARRGL
jgi:ribonuclease P protein component